MEGAGELRSLAEQAGFTVQSDDFPGWIKRKDKALHIHLAESRIEADIHAFSGRFHFRSKLQIDILNSVR